MSILTPLSIILVKLEGKPVCLIRLAACGCRPYKIARIISLKLIRCGIGYVIKGIDIVKFKGISLIRLNISAHKMLKTSDLNIGALLCLIVNNYFFRFLSEINHGLPVVLILKSLQSLPAGLMKLLSIPVYRYKIRKSSVVI